MELVQQRDSRGHFTDKAEPDAELAAKWAEFEKRAAAAEKVCKRFNFSMDWLGIRKLFTGVWSLGQSEAALWWFFFGLMRGKNLKDDEYVPAIAELTDALGVTEEFFAAHKKRVDEAQPAA